MLSGVCVHAFLRTARKIRARHILVGWVCLFAPASYGQTAPHDANLPSATPTELKQLSDDRLREKIMHDSLAPYHGACSCPYQVRSHGRTCRGHIHILKDHPPLCYPREVTADMLADWRRKHP